MSSPERIPKNPDGGKVHGGEVCVRAAAIGSAQEGEKLVDVGGMVTYLLYLIAVLGLAVRHAGGSGPNTRGGNRSGLRTGLQEARLPVTWLVEKIMK